MASLDELDVRILREFFSGERYFYANRLAPAAELARRVGAHRNTVQTRLKRLTEAQLFLPAVLDVAAARLGLASCRVVFSPPGRHDEETVMLVDGVKALNRFGTRWGAVVHAEDEAALDNKVQLLERITDSRVEDWSFRHSGADGMRTPLTARQCRVLADVVGRERPDWPALARSLGLSERTVRREVDSLVDGHVLTVYPLGDASADAGQLGYVRIPKAGPESAPDNFVMRHESPEGWHYFVLAPNIHAFDAQAAQIRSRWPGAYAVPWTARRTNPRYHRWLRAVLLRQASILES